MQMNPYRGRRGGFWVGLVRDWGLALLIAVIIFVGWSFLMGSGSVLDGGDAPDFTLQDLEGESVQLSSLQGQPVVLNFWATWCGPCKAEIPELIDWRSHNPDVPLLGISTDRGMPTKRLQRFVDRARMNYPVLHDSSGSVADTWGVHTLPTTVVVTADGHVGPHHVGMIDERGLDRLVEQARAHTH